MGHLASQVGKTQMRIMRLPEMMCPKNGTNMIGFLPESEQNQYISSLQNSQTTYQREGRGRVRQKLMECLLCSSSTFGKCSPVREFLKITPRSPLALQNSITGFVRDAGTDMKGG